MSNTVDSRLPVVSIPTCCSSPEAEPGIAPAAGETKFHFALNVSNLERSIAFYRVLFACPPAKHYADYAKFELSQPPLVFSLVPISPGSGGSLSHFGLPVASRDEVDAVAERLAAAGLEVTCQQGTVCGYARQDKIWIADPDQNFWEIYCVQEDVDPETVRASFDGLAPPIATNRPESVSPNGATVPSPIIWEHRVLVPVPPAIPHADETVDEIRLVGTFNDDLSAETRSQLLKDAFRALRPGGLLSVHGLVASRPLNELPPLPGVASLVRQVPFEPRPLQEISQAGFDSVRITRLSATANFRHGDAEMREIKIEARKPAQSTMQTADRGVLYKGPFASAVDEGQTFLRGRRTVVSQQTWNRLAASTAASQFVFLGASCTDDCSRG